MYGGSVVHRIHLCFPWVRCGPCRRDSSLGSSPIKLPEGTNGSPQQEAGGECQI